MTLDLPGFGASAKPPDHRVLHPRRHRRRRRRCGEQLGVDHTVVVAHDYSVSIGQELLARRLDDAGPSRRSITAVVWCNGGLWSDLHRQTLGQQLLLDPEHGAAVADAMDEAALTNGLQGTWGTSGSR